MNCLFFPGSDRYSDVRPRSSFENKHTSQRLVRGQISFGSLRLYVCIYCFVIQGWFITIQVLGYLMVVSKYKGWWTFQSSLVKEKDILPETNSRERE